MELFKSETYAPTPLLVGLVLGTVLLALLLSVPDAAQFVFGLPRSLERVDTGPLGGAIGRAAVQYWPVTLALVPAAAWAVRREVSRDQRAGR